MKDIQLKDFKIIVDVNSARKEEISDEIYFSKKYRKYISNSSMGNINPSQDGGPEKYKNPPRLSTTALSLGSAVHCATLQPDEFILAPKCNKPTAKLGATVEKVKYYRKKGYSIYNAIKQAAWDCDYYRNSIDSKVKDIIKKGFSYYWQTRNYEDNVITLPDRDWEAATACIENVEKDRTIQKLLHPTDEWGDNLPSFNEDALFINVIVTYKGKCVTLPLKMKADNWTIDEENKVLTLNDLKTTSSPVAWFMNEEYGSFHKYHYYRQFALYMMILKNYCMLNYGVNKKWKLRGHVLVVNTQDFQTKVCYVTKEHMKLGKKEYEKLLKMIAYYELFGYEEEVNFV